MSLCLLAKLCTCITNVQTWGKASDENKSSTLSKTMEHKKRRYVYVCPFSWVGVCFLFLLKHIVNKSLLNILLLCWHSMLFHSCCGNISWQVRLQDSVCQLNCWRNAAVSALSHLSGELWPSLGPFCLPCFPCISKLTANPRWCHMRCFIFYIRKEFCGIQRMSKS